MKEAAGRFLAKSKKGESLRDHLEYLLEGFL